MEGTAEKTGERLRRLAAAAERSIQAAEDDIRAFHDEVEAAKDAGKSVRWISQACGKSVTQTFRIMHALTGPRAKD